MYIITFLQFQKELYYISEGIILKNSQKDLRRCEGFQKVLYSASHYHTLKKSESLTKRKEFQNRPVFVQLVYLVPFQK